MKPIDNGGYSMAIAMLVATLQISQILHKVGPGSSYKWGEITPRSRVILPTYKAINGGYHSISNL